MNGIKRYRIKNVDCAACAENIERELKKIKGVSIASVSLINSTLNIDNGTLKEIREKVKSVEPGAEVEEISSPSTGNFHKNKNIRLFRIIITAVLLLSGILLNGIAGTWKEYVIFLSAYLISGWDVLFKAGRNIIKGKVFDENFLMSLATIGAILLGDLPEAVTVMFFYILGEYIQGSAVRKSKHSIKELLDIRPSYANIFVEGMLIRVDPEKVNVNDTIVVKPGERIPLDGTVAEGASFVDTYALTGEPVPRRVEKGTQVLAGMINKQGVISVKVTKIFSESSIARIIDLIENSVQKKAPAEKFISTFARYYTPAVVAAAFLTAVIPPLFFPHEFFSTWIYRALVVLVVSCPCALIISIPLTYYAGIGRASRKGILIKGSGFLESVTKIKTVVFDKTGTLTKGIFKVTAVVSCSSYTEDDIIEAAAYAELHSNHPVAEAIKEAYKKKIVPASIANYNEYAGNGIITEFDGVKVVAGNERLLQSENIEFPDCKLEGTIVHIALNGKYTGYIIISDELKENSAYIVAQLKEKGKDVIILTGDNKFAAEKIAGKLDADKVYADLLPADKVRIMEEIIAKNKSGDKTAFAGDGINDAPVIARADIGIALGGIASDAAVEAADIVIMEDDPSKILSLFRIAEKTKKIVWQNILFAIAVKAAFVVLGMNGLAVMWEAVFADMGVAILAILNSLRMLKK